MESESILLSLKKMLGMDQNYNAFNDDIIIHANSVFARLSQLGVGPRKPFHISGELEKWSDFLGDRTDLDLVKSYMYLKVRLIFDPPTTGVLHEAMERQIHEFEWCLNVQAETPGKEVTDENSNKLG